MDFEVPRDGGIDGISLPELDSGSPILPPPPVMIVPALALTLAACGGGGEASTQAPQAGPPAVPAPPPAPPPPPPPPPPTTTQAARFLAQATMGTKSADIDAVVAQGFDGWLGAQFVKPRPTKFWDWLVANGYTAIVNMFRQSGHDPMVWSSLISSDDQLRQRVGTALMNIFVVSVDGLYARWQQFGMASYMDIVWDNAFGNFRTLLEQITLSQSMGFYLSFIKSKKANGSGALPDENYAREIMQLFTIGLYQLNLDGTHKLVNGKPVDTYAQSDVTGLARVFTGWTSVGSANAAPDILRNPMTQEPADHELGVKTFLGKTIPAGTDGAASLKIALDTLFAHPNVAPFFSKQMIQHLVTSNPSPAYVQRVATVFENNGSGVRGDLRAVFRAILLDVEARDDAGAASSATFGKLREPVMRLTGWARAFGATSPSNAWAIGDTSGATNSLSQGIGRSPSVFNFFRPGYVPPNSAISTRNMVAPEFQITNEQTNVGYMNFMYLTTVNGAGDFKADFTEFLAKATDSKALIDLINLRLAANQVSAATVAQIKTAVDSLATATPTELQNRVHIASLMILASPEYIVLK